MGVNFDGHANSSITIPHDSRLDVHRDNRTAVSFWINTTLATGTNNILFKKVDGTPKGWEVYWDGTNSRVYVAVDDGTVQTVAYGTGAAGGDWHNVFFTIVNDRVNLYIDNVFKMQSGTDLTDTLENSTDLIIGGNNGFVGDLAQLWIFNQTGMSDWHWYRNQYKRWKVPGDFMDAMIPMWENTGDKIYAIDQTPIASNAFDTNHVTWVKDPPLTYKGG